MSRSPSEVVLQTPAERIEYLGRLVTSWDRQLMAIKDTEPERFKRCMETWEERLLEYERLASEHGEEDEHAI